MMGKAPGSGGGGWISSTERSSSAQIVAAGINVRVGAISVRNVSSDRVQLLVHSGSTDGTDGTVIWALGIGAQSAAANDNSNSMTVNFGDEGLACDGLGIQLLGTGPRGCIAYREL